MVKTFLIISVIAIAFILITVDPVQADCDNSEDSLSGIVSSIIDMVRNFLDNILGGKTVDKNPKPRSQKWISF